MTEPKVANLAINSLSECEFADFQERAAILEFDAGLTRDEAERQALAMVLEKRPDPNVAM
jgi:hypothetical protein